MSYMSNETRVVLENPTVKDVIDHLSKFPPDTPFRIEDPDTFWTISLVHARFVDGVVWFTGEYYEMDEYFSLSPSVHQLAK